MLEVLIIDGYNLISSWPELAELKQKSLEHARDRLINLLVNFRWSAGKRVIVVFDAHLVKGGSGSYTCVDGVEVYYTPQGVTADTFIQRLVGRLVSQHQVCVVTGDYEEQKSVFYLGAVRMTPREFWLLVDRATRDFEQWSPPGAKDV